MLFLLFNITFLVISYATLKEFIGLLSNNELYSHIVLIPFVSGYFIFSDRKKIFYDNNYSIKIGLALLIIGSILFSLGHTQGAKLNQNDYFSLFTFSAVILWIGGFVLFYGTQAFRKASFPILFLILIVPIPSSAVEYITFILQHASAEISYWYFKIVGVPIYREDLVFYLPGISVKVAKECSGIRSSIALFITSILAGHLFLRTGWRKVILALSIFPISVLKNGMRIVTLSLLGAYVDISYLTDNWLHKSGGIPFFILALLLLIPILWLLRRTEKVAE